MSLSLYVFTIVAIAAFGLVVNLQTPYSYARPPIYNDMFDWTYNPLTDGNLQPFREKLPPSSVNVILDQHSHTTYSDGSLSPEMLIQWHLANGFNTVVITDHNTFRGGIEALKVAALPPYKGNILVMTGMEWRWVE